MKPRDLVNQWTLNAVLRVFQRPLSIGLLTDYLGLILKVRAAIGHFQFSGGTKRTSSVLAAAISIINVTKNSLSTQIQKGIIFVLN